jgi:hypothetical protein
MDHACIDCSATAPILPSCPHCRAAVCEQCRAAEHYCYVMRERTPAEARVVRVTLDELHQLLQTYPDDAVAP